MSLVPVTISSFTSVYLYMRTSYAPSMYEIAICIFIYTYTRISLFLSWSIICFQDFPAPEKYVNIFARQARQRLAANAFLLKFILRFPIVYFICSQFARRRFTESKFAAILLVSLRKSVMCA